MAATTKKAGPAKAKKVGKTKATKDLNPKADDKIKGGKNPRGFIGWQ